MQAVRLCSAGRALNYNRQTVAAIVKINSYYIWRAFVFISDLFALVCMKHFIFHRSSGPQKCSACIKEDIFEEPTSILKQGCVSICFITR